RLLTVLLFLFASTGVYSQLGKIHYIPPIAKGDIGSDVVAVQHIYLTTPIEGTINAYIKPVGGTRLDWIPVSFSNNNPLDWPIPNDQFTVNDNSAGKVSNKGYIIESSNVFYVNVRFNSSNEAQQGSFVSKGESAPGTEFRTAVAPNGTTTSTNIDFTAINFISIMATEDNTLVEIDGINFSSSSIINAPPTGPIALDKGESYVLIQRIRNTNASEKTPAQRLDLIGAGIKSVDALGNKDQSKPIVVNSGSVGGTWDGMGGGGGGDRSRDYHIDQLVGLETLQNGNEYIFVKGEGNDGHENVMLIASEANTSIFIDGSTTVYKTLTNAGDFLIIEGNEYTANLYVTSSSPVFAFQSTGRSNRANQGMIFVPPLNCSAKGDINNVGFVGYPTISSSTVGFGLYSIVTQVGATLSIENKDGDVLADKTGTAPIDLNTYESTVTGNSAYVTYLIENSSIDNEKHISIKGDGELYFSYISLNNFATSGSFFSGFITDPQIFPDLTIIPKGICIDGSGSSNVILETFQTFDTYLWEVEQPRKSGIFVPASGTNNQQSFTPAVDGIYRLSGTLICSSDVYISSNQIVSVCPTDYDNDGIIDNLDLDLDNDGILNSLESIDKIEIDLSDPNNAKASLPTGNTTFNSDYIPSNSSTFNGNTNGTFLSQVVPSGINENSKLEINPFINSGANNESFNIRFTEDPSVTFSGDPISEYYSLTVYPSDKNVTLLDPGERVLVNDGSGFVTTGEFGFSGNTIIFKYNSNPLNSSVEFNFYASDIEGIEFNHHVTSLATSDANFNGLIEIIDYDIDSDNDGIPDKLDLDSDGDGCPDVEEADINFDNATGIRPRIFRDPDKNSEYGDQSTTPPFKLEYLATGGTLDSRGRIIDLIDATSGTYIDPPLDPNSGIPVYLETNAPNVIFSAGGQPEDYQVCETGQDAEFKVNVDPGGYTPFYQWQVDIQDGNGWKNLLDDPATTPLTIDATLEIKSVTYAMNGWEYRVLTWSDGAFCYSISDTAVLKVEATLPTAKAVNLADPLIIKCDDDYDGKATFDLTLLDDYIRGPLQSSTDFEVSYFENATDAASPITTGITTPSAFTWNPVGHNPANPTVQTKDIHVRVRNINSNCLADPMSFQLTTNPIPLLFAIPPIEQCNNIVFDLVVLQPSLSINAATETFEFFDSSGTLITSPSNYQLPDLTISNEELITVVVKNNPS
ncbi:IgGFc-binding protein, partial [Flavobacteriaceae bacterium]|nr:IgGFc-binding protein [Flavobacteriaceae bacterium]